MALFGAPFSDEEHALGACCAALEMHVALAGSGLDIQLRVGVHSGEIVVHKLRVGTMQSLDAAGEAVHLAARLQQGAPSGSTWMSEATFALARGRVETRLVGTLPLRGFDMPVVVHLLQAADASLSRLDVAGRRGLSPFVNRQDELRAILVLRRLRLPAVDVRGQGPQLQVHRSAHRAEQPMQSVLRSLPVHVRAVVPEPSGPHDPGL